MLAYLTLEIFFPQEIFEYITACPRTGQGAKEKGKKDGQFVYAKYEYTQSRA
jgi:hypothetical protein